MLKPHYCGLTVLLLALAPGCSDSQSTRTTSGGAPATQNSGPGGEGPRESAVLKQEMQDFMLETLRMSDPGTDPAKVRDMVEEMITSSRSADPNFLMVSPQVEERLRAGLPIEDAAQRITDAETFLRQSGRLLPGFARLVYRDFQAGTLSPVRTELLAQIMVAATKMSDSPPPR